MFSADTEEEAKTLITMACPTDIAGNPYARELAQEQTMENLVAFSDRLQECWNFWQKAKLRRNP